MKIYLIIFTSFVILYWGFYQTDNKLGSRITNVIEKQQIERKGINEKNLKGDYNGR